MRPPRLSEIPASRHGRAPGEPHATAPAHIGKGGFSGLLAQEFATEHREAKPRISNTASETDNQSGRLGSSIPPNADAISAQSARATDHSGATCEPAKAVVADFPQEPAAAVGSSGPHSQLAAAPPPELGQESRPSPSNDVAQAHRTADNPGPPVTTTDDLDVKHPSPHRESATPVLGLGLDRKDAPGLILAVPAFGTDKLAESIPAMGRGSAGQVLVARLPLTDAGSAVADVHRIIELGRQLGAAIETGTRFVRIRLDPPDLGVIEVDLRVREQAVFLQIHAEHPTAAARIQEQIGCLQTQLHEQGLTLAGFELDGGGTHSPPDPEEKARAAELANSLSPVAAAPKATGVRGRSMGSGRYGVDLMA
jgi:hypothetical protein